MNRVVALAGGVGGAKLVNGLANCLTSDELTVIVNIGDDFEHLGLWICPDLDTVCYTLAGISNPATGWGRAEESWNAFESLAALGGATWFRLGDRDLGIHLERSRRLREGDPLSRITRDFCLQWGVQITVLPVSDDRVPTWVYTEIGELPFQEYFVKLQCRPQVTGFRFEGVECAHPAPGVSDALRDANLVVICPSNPWVSIDPILSVHGVREAVAGKRVIAVSPIIGGQAVKGPAAKMYQELGIQPTAAAVAKHYGELLWGFVFDEIDGEQSLSLQNAGLRTLVLNTMMKSTADQVQLASKVLEFGAEK